MQDAHKNVYAHTHTMYTLHVPYPTYRHTQRHTMQYYKTKESTHTHVPNPHEHTSNHATLITDVKEINDVINAARLSH